MTEIVYNRQDLSVTIKGHAGYAEHGKDIVCASISSLAYALGMYVDKLNDRGRLYFPPVIKMDGGDAEISAVVQSLFEREARAVYDTICDGFEMISMAYPEHVSFRKVYHL